MSKSLLFSLAAPETSELSRFFGDERILLLFLSREREFRGEDGGEGIGEGARASSSPSSCVTYSTSGLGSLTLFHSGMVEHFDTAQVSTPLIFSPSLGTLTLMTRPLKSRFLSSLDTIDFTICKAILQLSE